MSLLKQEEVLVDYLFLLQNLLFFCCFLEGQVYQASSYVNVVMQLVFGPVLENLHILSSNRKVELICKCIEIFMKTWMEHILKQSIIFRYLEKSHKFYNYINTNDLFKSLV